MPDHGLLLGDLVFTVHASLEISLPTKGLLADVAFVGPGALVDRMGVVLEITTPSKCFVANLAVVFGYAKVNNIGMDLGFPLSAEALSADVARMPFDPKVDLTDMACEVALLCKFPAANFALVIPDAEVD